MMALLQLLKVLLAKVGSFSKVKKKKKKKKKILTGLSSKIFSETTLTISERLAGFDPKDNALVIRTDGRTDI